MKVVKNDCLQTITVYFNTEAGCMEKYMRPGETIVVPEGYITEQIQTLCRRKLFKITNA